MSAAPDFVICLECESPCYTFEWERDKISDILCPSCGNDNPDFFAPEEDAEALATGWSAEIEASR